ncbi:hypothetical protein GUT189_06790 [Streptococcus ruminantium]|nr:hypothetical protein GUT189_06790 [Streptococcus ruminantium]
MAMMVAFQVLAVRSRMILINHHSEKQKDKIVLIQRMEDVLLVAVQAVVAAVPFQAMEVTQNIPQY